MASGIFPNIWNKSNTAPVNKKRKKKTITFLRITGTIFERVLFNSIFKYNNENNLLSENQWGV